MTARVTTRGSELGKHNLDVCTTSCARVHRDLQRRERVPCPVMLQPVQKRNHRKLERSVKTI
jgi:predicted metal-binding protein